MLVTLSFVSYFLVRLGMEIYTEIVKTELAELKQCLKKDLGEIITTVSGSGKVLKYNKKVGEARISFINLIRGLIASKSISIEDANKAINLFGRKTTNLYWIK